MDIVSSRGSPAASPAMVPRIGRVQEFGIVLNSHACPLFTVTSDQDEIYRATGVSHKFRHSEHSPFKISKGPDGA
jgi:hypothetical protein